MDTPKDQKMNPLLYYLILLLCTVTSTANLIHNKNGENIIHFHQEALEQVKLDPEYCGSKIGCLRYILNFCDTAEGRSNWQSGLFCLSFATVFWQRFYYR